MQHDQKTLEILKNHQALVENGHFVYASGRHGSIYFNKDAIYPHTSAIAQLCKMMAQQIALVDDGQTEAIVAPVLGGIILSQWVAHYLRHLHQREILAVYAEKTPDSGFELKRGYDKLIKGKKIWVVEDVLTTGGSVKKVLQAVRGCEVKTLGVSALCNRGGVTAQDLEVPHLKNLLEFRFQTFDAENCPLCTDQVPVNTQLGKGAQFLLQKST